MNALDWGIVFLYLAGLVTASLIIGRRQHDLHDYFLHHGRIKWWQSGISTMATQLGAISFVSAPAFVALADGGGLKWLGYELGVPLGILIAMVLILPTLHGRRYISIYEYLETRFDRSVRAHISALFQLGRVLATAVSVLAGGIIVSTALGISTPLAIVLIGGLTILYALVGGLRAVVLSDVAQMGMILLGVLVCGGLALETIGWQAAWASFDPERLKILDYSHLGVQKDDTYAFWPMVIGGIFLYASYYGCDQSQVQRELSVGSLRQAQSSLLLNAFGRAPMVSLYCLMGLVIGAALLSPLGIHRAADVLQITPETLKALLSKEPDRMLPIFVLAFLPHGLIGFVYIAILSALMSSLDSAVNSLSAVTVRDFYQVYVTPRASERHYLLMSKVFTALWGGLCIVSALFFYSLAESTRQTTIVLINAVGSLLYGPILAAFLLGILTQWADGRSVKAGVWSGVLANLLVWLLTDISWLWWNLIGLVVSFSIAALAATPNIVRGTTVVLNAQDPDRGWNRQLLLPAVGIYFLSLVFFLDWLQRELAS